jgi:hypothetical protein
VEDYAERLRALHRDLTLVLEAVERGLAVSGERAGAGPVASEPLAPEPAIAAAPSPELDPLFDPAPHREREPVLLHPHATSGGPRVEVLPAPSGPATRASGEDRRAPVTLPPDIEPQDPSSLGPSPFPPRPSAREADEPDLPVEAAWVERPDPIVPVTPSGAVPDAAVDITPAAAPAPSPPPVRVEAAAPPPAPADRPWVQSSGGPGAQTAWVDAPAPAGRRGLPPLLVAALLTGWLVALALLLALLLD